MLTNPLPLIANLLQLALHTGVSTSLKFIKS